MAPKGAIFIPTAYEKLPIIGCTTTLHDNNSLPRDMIDVTPELGTIQPLVTKIFNAGNEFFFYSGFTFDSRYNFSSCQTFSIGLGSKLSEGVRHQLIPCSSKKACALFEVCLGSLSCIKRWFGKVSLMNGINVLKNAIQIGLHYSLENIDFHGAHPADASPDTNLERVLAFSLLVYRPFDCACGETESRTR